MVLIRDGHVPYQTSRLFFFEHYFGGLNGPSKAVLRVLIAMFYL